MQIEEDGSQEDSFQDGQPILQPREAEGRRILADIRSLEGGEVSFSNFSSSSCRSCSSSSFKHIVMIIYLFIQFPAPGGSRPQRVPTPQSVEPTPQRFSLLQAIIWSSRTLRVTPVHGYSHSSLSFIQQPSNSLRAASSASQGFSPRNKLWEGRKIIPPSFGRISWRY